MEDAAAAGSCTYVFASDRPFLEQFGVRVTDYYGLNP
jgi:hypothetical protein